MALSKFQRQEGVAHLLLIVLVAALGATVVGAAAMQYQSQKQASRAAAELANQVTNSGKPAKVAPAANVTPSPTPKLADTPTPSPTPTPRSAMPIVTGKITHPTQANCNDQLFTVYASATGGTKEYYETNISSRVYQTIAFGQPFQVKCGSWSTAGWALDGNNSVRFEDISLTHP